MEPAEQDLAQQTTRLAAGPSARTLRKMRYVAVGLGVGVLAYLVAVFCNLIKKDDRLSPADLALLAISAVAIAAMFNPAFITRIDKLKFHDFEVEINRIQKNQEQQTAELDGIRFVLSLLLKDEELQHLRNLHAGTTHGYVGNGSLPAELGKLLDLRLIDKLPNRRLREFRDPNVVLDLAAVVRLTPRGEDFLRRLPDYKAAAAGG